LNAYCKEVEKVFEKTFDQLDKQVPKDWLNKIRKVNGSAAYVYCNNTANQYAVKNCQAFQKLL